MKDPHRGRAKDGESAGIPDALGNAQFERLTVRIRLGGASSFLARVLRWMPSSRAAALWLPSWAARTSSRVHPLELATRQFQGDAATHHLCYEDSQLLAHSIFSRQSYRKIER